MHTNSFQLVEKMHHLSALELFQDLSKREIEELNHVTTMSTVPKGRIFYRPEDLGETLFILVEGRVQLYRINPNGKKLVIATLSTQTIFGQATLLESNVHNTFAEAVEDCLVCAISRTNLERQILNKPHLTMRILDYTRRQLHDAEEQLENIAFKTVTARIANHILGLAEEQSSKIITNLTHQDLAERVGTYRETATQILNDLKGQGYIEIGRKRITILNEDKLTLVAGG